MYIRYEAGIRRGPRENCGNFAGLLFKARDAVVARVQHRPPVEEYRTPCARVSADTLVDCLHGEAVPRAEFPAALSRQCSLENLYIEDLPDFWRMLYTIVRKSG